MGKRGGRTVGCFVIFAAATWLEWFATPSNWLVVLQVAVGLGFVIFVHELGHFLVAKACGVKCEKFFLGFDVGGLKLASFKWGETEYGIGALPLGGYVKMLGQDDNPASAAEEARRARATGDLPPEPTSGPHRPWDPRSYPAQSVPERMAIISAGVVMNVIFAVLMAALAMWLGVKELTCEVSSVRPGGAAWRSGIRTGDEIMAIGGKKSPIFSDLQKGVTLGDVGKGVEFTIRRPADGDVRTVTLHPDTDLGPPTIGVTSPVSTTIPPSLEKDDRGRLRGGAGRAEPPLEPGDRIEAVDGRKVATYAELIAALSRKPSETVSLSVVRDRPGSGARIENGDGETLSVELPARPARSLGLAMTLGPIVALQDDSPAVAAGLRVGDRVEAIDGEAVGDPSTLASRLVARAGSPTRLMVRRSASGREAEAVEIEVVPREADWIEESKWPSSPISVPAVGAAFAVDATVSAVAPGGPADKAGIVAGDSVERAVLAVADGAGGTLEESFSFGDGERNWPYFDGVLQIARDDVEVTLSLKRKDTETRTVPLRPVDATDRFMIDRGLVFEPLTRMVRAESVPAALVGGVGRAVGDLSLVYRFLQKLTSSQISPRLLGGPIEIAKQAGRSAEEGFSRFLLFLTMLSANLAVINFLPIPVLDGGHMVFLAYELIRGKPPSEGVVAVLSYLGLALILTLMMFVFGLDLGLISRR
jgi:regulator of sigma E protease